MKRFTSSDSFAALFSISPPSTEEKPPKSNQEYTREFQAMFDTLEDEEYPEDALLTTTEKKRRLNVDQVKALEKNFEVENKLEPERKLRLAEELGLQPRQVAIWFQNRRARWKTKQLERDYQLLKADYEALKVNYNNLEKENQSLTEQVKEMKGKLREENADSSSQSVKEECPVSESENNFSVQSQSQELSDNNNNLNRMMKDQNQINCPPPSNSFMNWIQLSESRSMLGNGFQLYHEPHLVKLEDQSMFNTEESCNFFSVDQAPTLHWQFTEQ